MKVKMSISMDEELLEKVKDEAEKCGTSVSELINVATMAMVDRKAFLKHTSGLFRKLGKLYGKNVEKRLGEVVGGLDDIKQEA